MREKYPFTGHFGNTHGIPPITGGGGGGRMIQRFHMGGLSAIDTHSINEGGYIVK